MQTFENNASTPLFEADIIESNVSQIIIKSNSSGVNETNPINYVTKKQRSVASALENKSLSQGRSNHEWS